MFYDFNDPLKTVSKFVEKYFDYVIADPPFWQEDCLMKISKTIKYLAGNKVLLCAGKFLL